MGAARRMTQADGGITALFVRRPVLAFVFNTLIAVAGLAALYGVEVRELPAVDRPVVSVTTRFEGAAAETIDREITATIESAVTRIAGVSAISSSSSFGRSRVTIEFNENVDIDAAASDVRDAVGRVQNDLPEDADVPTVVKADDDAQPVMRLAVTSDEMSIEDMTVYVEDEIVDKLATVPGVADVQVYGERDKIFRVDIDQARLASLGFTVGDIGNALSTVAFDSPAGSLTSASHDLIVRATATVATPQDLENIQLSRNVRLGDVAAVALGPDIGESRLRSNGKNGIGLGIVRQAQSNTLDISEGVRAAVERIRPVLPPGVEIAVTSDDAIFIKGAIHEVEIALAIAVTIVLVVIFLFLRDLRATVIPGVAIPVALIGTVAAIYLAGFSINILTLLALVLATGLVVDDAIVVLENIVRRRNQGMGPRAAAVLGTQEVFFAVIATTAVLMAVFVPLSFLPGQAGGLFREFGFVLAFSVFLSSIVALSLCPMLASRMLVSGERGAAQEAATGPLGRLGNGLSRLYARTLHFCLDAPAVVLLASALFAGAAYGLFGLVKSELTPTEDRAVAFMRVSAPEGVSLDYLTSKMRSIEMLIEPLRERGEIRNTFSIVGWGGSNSGFLVLGLAPWEERERTQQEILDEVNGLAAGVSGVRAFAFQPNSLGIRGSGSGLQFAVAGYDYDRLSDAAIAIVEEMEKDPRFDRPRLTQDATQPQLKVEIDRQRAADLGIEIAGLGESLQALLDGRRIGSLFIEDKSFDIKLVSTTDPVNDPTDLENIFVRTGDARFVPLSTVATLREEAVPPSLQREEQMRVVRVTSGLENGFALGDALARAEEIAAPHLPEGARIIPLAEAATLGGTADSMLTIFGFALIIILLVLAAQFESFISALIIMATVPLGLACAVFALLLTGTSLNVYSQIGLVLLVGVMAKNGILIVEFANQLRDRGLGVRAAVEQAALIRLRPVAMTMICTVVGGVPLVLATGAGAEARIALGWVIVGGLGLSALSTLYLTPVAYLLLGRFTTPKAEEEARLQGELERAASTQGR
ncbi:efflux RND transporter permease subunit [Chelativorans intermedius]|uniref:Efflux RND transporter permease subunit n=1 Tax=Chelativorans intermedius TaxID=515947 RepID=A0ABV6D442_9HYPH|nr:efflux RND transporter permease subunit [Chelativorans intermedius]MCT8997711.1 efflux RND transporter permease subunit [Chelativorans intermedius]